jgi:endoglucanase
MTDSRTWTSHAALVVAALCAPALPLAGCDGGADASCTDGDVPLSDAGSPPASPGSDAGPPPRRGDAGTDAGAPDAGPPAPGPDGGSGCPECETPWLAGVNLAGAEWGEHTFPGTYGTDYIYPMEWEVDYYVDKGMNLFRIGFRWERLQREHYAPLHETELMRLEGIVRYALSKGAHVILNPHNYATYDGAILGPDPSDVPYDAFADFWGRLAAVFADDPRVIFGLVNEPHSLPAEHWLAAVNAAIAAIRAAGAANLIAVPGVAWTTALTWYDDYYGTPNAEVMRGVEDPMNNFAFEVHQYLDDNSSGAGPECVSPTIGSERVAAFTGWLREHGYRGILAETAGPDTPTCEAAIGDLLTYLEDNDDVWIGWAWWAGGPWWSDSYQLLLDPRGGEDQPQMAWLEPHL